MWPVVTPPCIQECKPANSFDHVGSPLSYHVLLFFSQHRRGALHYAARCADTDKRVKISETLRNAGADADALDAVSEGAGSRGVPKGQKGSQNGSQQPPTST